MFDQPRNEHLPWPGNARPRFFFATGDVVNATAVWRCNVAMEKVSGEQVRRLFGWLLTAVVGGASGGFLVGSLDRNERSESGETTGKTQRIKVREHTRERATQR